MPKKQEKITFKSLLNKIMENSFQSLISVAAEESDHLVKWIKDIPQIGRKIKRL